MYYHFNGDTFFKEESLRSVRNCEENSYMYVHSPFERGGHQWYLRPDNARWIPISDKNVPEKHRMQLLLLL